MTRTVTFVVALAALGTLAACSGDSWAARYARMVSPTTYARLALDTTTLVIDLVANTTSSSEGSGGGTRSEYLAPDGDAFRTVPGSQTVESGQWQAQETPGKGSGTEICSRYAGRSWECLDTREWLAEHSELQPGDPGGLEQRAMVR